MEATLRAAILALATFSGCSGDTADTVPTDADTDTDADADTDADTDTDADSDADTDTGHTGLVDPPVVFTPGACVIDRPGARCGTVEVPERHGSGSQRTVTLTVEVLPATSGAQGTVPLVMFNGGPGSDVFGLADLFEPGELMEPLGADHDVVLYSERGTSGAEPLLDCPELAAVDAVFDQSDEQRSAVEIQAYVDCRARLVSEGIDLAAFVNGQRAADVPDVMTALGYARWHVWGVSGGAMLTQMLIRDFPDGLASATADSGGFPDADLGSIVVTLYTNASARFDRLFAECAADRACNLLYPDLEDRLFSVVADLEAHPRPVAVTHPTTGVAGVVELDGDRYLQILTNSMSLVSALPAVITLAYQGNFAAVEAVVPYTVVADTGPSFADGLYLSMFCSDIGTRTLADVATKGAHPEIVHALAPAVERVFDECAVWAVPPSPAPTVVTSDTVPLLILEGMYDTNRSPESGRALLPAVTHATVAEFPDQAHVVLDPCSVSITRAFLADPSTPPDLGCVPAEVDWLP